MNIVEQWRWPMRPLRSSVWCSLGGPMCHLGLSPHHLPRRKDVQERLHVVACTDYLSYPVIQVS